MRVEDVNSEPLLSHQSPRAGVSVHLKHNFNNEDAHELYECMGCTRVGVRVVRVCEL